MQSGLFCFTRQFSEGPGATGGDVDEGAFTGKSASGGEPLFVEVVAAHFGKCSARVRTRRYWDKDGGCGEIFASLKFLGC